MKNLNPSSEQKGAQIAWSISQLMRNHSVPNTSNHHNNKCNCTFREMAIPRKVTVFFSGGNKSVILRWPLTSETLRDLERRTITSDPGPTFMG